MKTSNLINLIAFMRSLPASDIKMASYAEDEISLSSCGTAGCIAGWALVVRDGSFNPFRFRKSVLCEAGNFLGLSLSQRNELFGPAGFTDNAKFPASRVISTLERLRDTYLATGQVVVDWGPEPGEEPKQAWTAPQVAEVINPALPAELTSLLRNTVKA